MTKRTIAIIGASQDRNKFGNKAVRAYAHQGYDVFPVHPTADAIEGIPVYRTVLDTPVLELDRISIYLSPEASAKILEEIARKPAREVWFNPGADTPEVLAKARSLGMNVVSGCSIVDLGIDWRILEPGNS
jgi:predicted CoA-binding protein